ncbi:MAG: ABC transporter permease [Thermogemmatispora sp.]|uniref:ABC transporter permease n=1 Tax=Thermogemmatispora sp. TaxID=1968838 RepID=UPI00260C55E1|nr:ABC transporter permease [Thermogemmatispora sp.]MBX5458830.1 ABC transporter permease [Thermogemmatispora sp.]
MNGARILALTTRIMQQIVRDRRTLALVFLGPLLVMSILYVVLTGSSGSVPTLALVRPTGAGSETLNTLIDRLLPPGSRLKTITILPDEVETVLNKGEADAALIFPSDLATRLARGEHPTLQLVLEGSDPSVASAMRETVTALVGQLNVALAQAQSQRGQAQGQLPPVNAPAAPLLTLATPRYLHGGPDYTFNDALAPVFIGVLSFFFVFLLTSVAFLRERSQGTIERVLASPLRRGELVMGYVCGFTLFALVQSVVVLLFVIFVLRVHYQGNLGLVFLVAILLTVSGVNMGIFLSTFAQNEFQIIQFIPLVFGLQVLLSGIFWPVAQLPSWLQPLSYLLPLTYANEALRDVMLKGSDFTQIAPQLAALLAFMLLMIGLSALTVRRQVA